MRTKAKEMSRKFRVAVHALSAITCSKRAIGDKSPTRHMARSLKTRESTLRAYLDGTKPIPRDGRVVRQLIYQLVWVADMMSNQVKADVLMTRARELDPDVSREEVRLRDLWKLQSDARVALTKSLSPGLHVAPFLAESGDMVMLAITRDHRLGCMNAIEVTSESSAPRTGGPRRVADSHADFVGSYVSILTPGARP